MYHIPPCQPCLHTVVHIQSLSEDALGIANVSTMANTAKPCIGTWREVLNILRFSFGDLPRVDKGVAGAGCNGDHLILRGINLLLSAKVVVLDGDGDCPCLPLYQKRSAACSCSEQEPTMKLGTTWESCAASPG